MNNSAQHLSLKRKSNLVIMTSISLLLKSFFVALASISLPDDRKARFGINSIVEGFGMAPTQSENFTGIPMTELDRLDISRFREALQAGGIIRDTGVYSSSMGTTLAIKASLLFGGDSANLKTDSFEKVRTIASLIKDIPNEIVITCFTDSRPVETAPFSSNWALSAARAMAIMNFLASSGVDYKRMRVYGMGPEHPVSSNSTEAGRNINSRVEITIAGKMPVETGTRAKEIKRGETPPPPIYNYNGYEIPIKEK